VEHLPDLEISETLLDRAFRIAVGDLTGNINLFRDGLLDSPAPCILAGLDYNTPWTRDAAFNTWYGGGLLYPHVARNTLLSVLMRDARGDVRIGGQYWDAIIWAHGAWQYFLYNGEDMAFLELAFGAVKNSLHYFEETEFDSRDGLFRGGACFQDGVAGYPDFFAPPGTKIGGIPEWTEHAGNLRAPVGGGVPCKALSTNCLYYRAYQVAGRMAAALGQTPDPAWETSARALRTAINTRFWSSELGRYRYLVDAPGPEDRQEGLGLAFALLFGVADDAQAESIFRHIYLSPHGMPCVWPTFERYESPGEFGRHSGPIWPQVNASWALACAARGRADLALLELKLLTAKACRDSEFIEVYHPETGVPYGGLQEDGTGGISHFGILHRQTWCATGYIAMTLFVRLALKLDDHTPLTAPQRAELLSRMPCCVSESMFRS
jgi:hypothetical protein